MAAVALSSVGASLGKLSLSGPVALNSRATEKTLTLCRPSTKHRPSPAAAAAGFFPILAKQNALKRQRQNEKRRVYHKARRSEMSTRMKKVLTAIEGLRKKPCLLYTSRCVLTAIEGLRKKPDLGEEDIGPIEKLIADAYSIIDKSAKVGTIHRNKASRRKSRLARAKRTLLMQAGLYTPAPAAGAGVEAVAA
ncbi:hypothetical protein CBR_g30802 [Chara braunii]|uniref:30S ribosomal protein S20, chloroplastic n=1 Tax=Chara braunii TaxID=69332 RepID=A0A388JXE0_CHABU|nr:hypothetical protein CBR_g30802 [Chara braunii]|eukprot:GBG62481.1 hypothetical protein CBR_g30802 [Chara braunii]